MEAFNREAPAIAKLTDSELSSEQLRALARQMKPQDAEALYQVISDENNSDEIRSVAIDLLTVKNDTASMMALKKFVGNKTTVNGKPWNTKKELETILRAQAVESIAAYPQKEIAFSTLSFLQRQVEEKFLNERIGRAAAQVSGLQAEASTAPAEDENLKQLVQ